MKRKEFLASIGGLSGLGLSALLPVHNEIEEIFTEQNQEIKAAGWIKRFGDGRDWFFEKRFGLFIHWGIYSIPGWHEQHQYRGKVKRSEYIKLKDQWNPVSFDPEKWLDLLEEAGMKYLTITTKHIDGFCMWDTKQTSFNTMNTPYRKDIIRMVADACHKRDIPLCFYYSNVDNNHPNYPNKGRAHEVPPEPGDKPDIEKYITFMREQIRELCTNYGKISGFWWDAIRWKEDVDRDPGLNQMIRELQPGIIINDRGFDRGDFGTPERDFEADNTLSFERPTEACQAVGRESWGYRIDEEYYTDLHLISSIDRYLTRDANYLLNVGPKPDGTIDPESTAILKRIGKWYSSVRESLEGVLPASGLTANQNVTLTSRNRTLYVHLNKDIQVNAVKLNPINVMPVKASLLNDGQKIDVRLRFNPSDHRVSGQKAYLNLLNLPINELCNKVPVIKLEFDRPVDRLIQSSSENDGILS